MDRNQAKKIRTFTLLIEYEDGDVDMVECAQGSAAWPVTKLEETKYGRGFRFSDPECLMPLTTTIYRFEIPTFTITRNYFSKKIFEEVAKLRDSQHGLDAASEGSAESPEQWQDIVGWRGQW